MATEVERLAAFVAKMRFEDLSQEAVDALKIRVLDSLGCALGALESPLIAMLRTHIEDFGGKASCTIIGDKKCAPDRAAFYNGALVRYLDFNDSFLAKHETCHPSDNLAAVLAATEYSKGSGKDFLLALAIAYQVQCRLSIDAPVRKKGFDHTTQGAFAAAAGVAKALNLSADQIAHAIAISAVSNNALRVTRTGALSHWKGLAFPHTAFSATHAAFLALRGVTGPLEVFEGNKGFKETISGPFQIEWEEQDVELVRKTIIKKYNAEIHSQSALEGILELRNQISPAEIERIEVEIFDVAYHIIGGGEEGGKKLIRTKEEADHSLPYMLAVALLDGKVTPEQYTPERINRKDVQTLLQKIHIHPKKEFSDRFPDEMPVHITINGHLTIDKTDYEGFFTRPMSWDHAVKKFISLAGDRQDIVRAVARLEKIPITTLTKLLRKKNAKHAKNE